MMDIDSVMGLAPVIPVLMVDDIAHARPLAEALVAGGLPMLRALAAPFRNVRFCPTGGISQDSAPEWLSEASVACVGGSWIAKRGETDWTAIEARARAAAALRG